MRRGFTLVEVLVVVIILGLLMALLFPAIAAMRESARETDCQHRMVQMARGIQSYTATKNAYPGWRQKVRGLDGIDAPVSWVLLITPQIDAKDIYDNWLREKDASKSRKDAQRPIWLCPSDEYKSRESGPVLSFVINAGRTDWPSKDPSDRSANGIAIDLGDPANYPTNKSTTVSYLTQADGLANTLLLSENLNAGAWTSADAEWKTTLNWWAPNQPEHQVNSSAEGVARPSSNHRGGVNAVMAAGQARFLDNDIDYAVYRAMLTCSDKHADETSAEPSP